MLKHPAFRMRDKGVPDEDPFKTRVIATYDFTVIRRLLRSEKEAEAINEEPDKTGSR